MHDEAPISAATCTIDMRFSPDDVAHGLELLLTAIGFTEATPGCLSCSVARDVLDTAQVHYTESWTSEAGFQRHARSEEFRRVLLTMDMCCEEPRVMVGNFSGHAGLTYLHQLCDQAAGA